MICAKCRDTYNSKEDKFTIEETGLCLFCCRQEGSLSNLYTMPNYYELSLILNYGKPAPIIRRITQIHILKKPAFLYKKKKEYNPRFSPGRILLVALRDANNRKILRNHVYHMGMYELPLNTLETYYGDSYDKRYNGLCRRCGVTVKVRSWKFCDECTNK